MTIVPPEGVKKTPRRAKLDWMKELRQADLSHAEFRVLVVILTYTNASMGNAYPGLQKIVRDACVTEKTARAALKTLTRKGWLVLTDEGGNKYWQGKANVYQVQTPKPGTEYRKGGSEERERGVTSSTPTGPSSRLEIIPPPAGASLDAPMDDDEETQYMAGEEDLWVEEQAGGLDGLESSTVLAMLEDGYHPKAALNKVLKDRAEWSA